ncbi:MAG TPA: serine/threonine-protein kinase, partial [Kofleriaceae bacterium]|nr:serine/threonine-protein kinase [Kofleriaceae bacterium]
MVGAFEIPGYVVGEQVGRGGFGEVYRARHEVIGRDVAIKVLHAEVSRDPDAIERFITEARAVGNLSHPNIVELYELGALPDGRQYFIMPFIRGKTLAEVLRERGRLTLAEALPILRGIAAGVDAAHAAGIAHRDLKPENVFFLDDGSIKLIDFGLAKLSGDDRAKTETGSSFGTPLYMSPEQCRGKNVTVATDAYSFGAVAYQLLTGTPVFSGDALALGLHHLNDTPDRPSKRCAELSANVDDVLLALLAKDPADRPIPLTRAVETLGSTARQTSRRRMRGLVVASAVAVLAVAGGFAAHRLRS